ncbi:cellulose biosynthesis protein BcsS [Azohydromonas aeria]|uniref:cellulose biosynthesis protein BcsS n=1 Tax=Azohydromonas aeria TaxID=2590212 RepID=UPI0012FB7F23|nr:cellulose biosynthesis protein BcsS [Azohydromonas aeria]
MVINRTARALALLAGLSAAAASAAHAQEAAPLAIAGVQASALGGYGYLGVIQPFAGAKLGEGWFHRTVASWLTYRYDATPGGTAQRVHARAPGLDFGLGRAWSAPDWGVELSAGVGLRHTRLRPDDPGNDARGTQWAFTPQLIARRQFTPALDGDLIASYSAGPNSRFLRARLGARAGASGWRLGGEGLLSSGPEYRQVGVGLFGARFFDSGLALELSAGRLRSREGREEPYVAIGVAKAL